MDELAWNPLAAVQGCLDSEDAEAQATAGAIVAYFALLQMPHGALRSRPEAQAALANCRDLISAACSIDAQIVQDSCERALAMSADTPTI